MSSPLDKPSAETSAISSATEDRDTARFQLSREMKILLGVLALGGAVGGWYVLSGAGTPALDTAVSTPPPQSAAQTPPSQTSTSQPPTRPAAGQTPPAGAAAVPAVTPGSGVVSDLSSNTGSGEVNSGANPVAVPQVPFLNPQGTPEPAAPDAGITASGINPADPLAAVPTSNPFQPLSVVRSNAAAAPAQAVTPLPSTPEPATNSAGTATAGTAPSLNTAGAIPLPSVPVAGVSGGGVTLKSGKTVSAPNPTISGSTASSGLGNGGAIPLPNVPLGGVPLPTSPVVLPGTSAGTTTSSTTGLAGTPPTPGRALPLPPVAVTPPAAGTITPGLSAPSLSSLPLGTVASGVQAAPGAGPAGTGSAGTATAGVQAAAIDQPGLISQYGSANAPAAPTPVVVSPLDQLVQSRSLAFTAVVLGPINTAIFKTDKGFVVVPTGQTLPDSDVTLKEVTATSATLSLGNDSKIIELDKR